MLGDTHENSCETPEKRDMRPSARLTTDFRERCARTGLTDATLAATFAEVAEPIPTNAPNENAPPWHRRGRKPNLKDEISVSHITG